MVPEEIAFDDNWDDREIFRQGLIASAEGVLAELPGASVYHLDFTISNDRLNLSGYEAVKYTNREDEPLEEIYFQLFPNASGGSSEIMNVKVDGRSVSPEYINERTVMRLSLSTPLDPGNSTIIEMDFLVNVAEEIGGNYGNIKSDLWRGRFKLLESNCKLFVSINNAVGVAKLIGPVSIGRIVICPIAVVDIVTELKLTILGQAGLHPIRAAGFLSFFHRQRFQPLNSPTRATSEALSFS